MTVEPLPGDVWVLEAVHDLIGDTIDTPMRWAGLSASAWVLVPVAAGLAVWAVLRRAWDVLVVVVTTAVLVWLVNPALKRVFERDRPEVRDLIEPTSRWSFPAGHAVASAAFATLVVLLAWPTRARRVVTALAVAYVVVVGASRIVLGVHYPTDLLAGWALAVGTVVAVASLTLANHGGARSDSRS